jgi:DNA polymerase III alpha subunit (gram-positive type)
MIREGYNPYNLNKPNPLEDIDFDTICYFDTETTGLKPSIAQIVEIAAVRGEEQFYEKIELTSDTKLLIQQQAQSFERKNAYDKTVNELLQMSNYYDDKAKTTSTEEMALRKFKDFAEQSSFLLAHNAEYDMKMINVRMKRYGIQSIKGIPVLDSLTFSRRFFIPLLRSQETEGSQEAKALLDQLTTKYTKDNQRKNVASNLGTLSKALFGQIENWHQALADVLTTKKIVEEVFSILMSRHSEHVKTPSFKKFYMMNKRAENRFR